MQISKRSQRRHHRERMINKVRQLQKHVWKTLASYRRFLRGDSPLVVSHFDPEIDARRLADNLAHCQHRFCQMPRKLFGPSNQEKARLQDELHTEPCEACGSDWNESCADWCPEQRMIRP